MSAPGALFHDTLVVLNDVAHERKVQRGRWGNEHDDGHSHEFWAVILGAYVGRVLSELLELRTPPTDEAALRADDRRRAVAELTLRAALIKVAATAVAWVEAIDRRYRP